jgi:hypothetical protein
MELSCKPDLADAQEHWRAFWNHDIIKRPCVAIRAPKDGVEWVPGPPSQFLPDVDFDKLLDQADAHHAGVYHAGESMPRMGLGFGPDQLAAFVGGVLDWSADSEGTTWSKPFVDDWASVLPLSLGGDTWERMLAMYRKAGERGDGKYLVDMLDMHSNFDWLAAIRSPDKLCMDLIDTPELVHRAMKNVRELYLEVCKQTYAAGNMAGRGTCGWLPYFCEGTFVTTQCDFCLLLSPDQFNAFVLPALVEECEAVDHSVYHYDGRGALTHFDAITGIESLDSIQWTISAGDEKQSMSDWVDLLQRFQNKGKSVYVSCGIEELKVLHPQLKPNLVFYDTWADSPQEADDLLHWVEKNT